MSVEKGATVEERSEPRGLVMRTSSWGDRRMLTVAQYELIRRKVRVDGLSQRVVAHRQSLSPRRFRR